MIFPSEMKLFCLILVVAVSLQESSGTPVREEPKYFCGRALAQMRSLLCLQVEQDFDSAYPHTTSISVKNRPIMDNALKPERTGGIVDECCLRPCVISDILSYC